MPLIDNRAIRQSHNRLNAYLSSFGEHSTYTKYMLSDLTVCGICGRPYYRRNSQTQNRWYVKRIRILFCQVAKQISVKLIQIYRQEELEQEVINQIESIKIQRLFHREWQNDTASSEMKQIGFSPGTAGLTYSLGSVSREQ